MTAAMTQLPVPTATPPHGYTGTMVVSTLVGHEQIRTIKYT